MEEVMKVVKGWEVVPEIKFVSQFFNHPLFIKAFAEIASTYVIPAKAGIQYDHYLFSYHGLPEHQILKASCDHYCRLGDCCSVFHGKNQYCYRAQCFETTRLLAEALGIKKRSILVCFSIAVRARRHCGSSPIQMKSSKNCQAAVLKEC